MTHIATILPSDAKPICLMDAQAWHCRFVIGEPMGPRTIYCGARKQSGSNFCPMHHRLSYKPVEKRK